MCSGPFNLLLLEPCITTWFSTCSRQTCPGHLTPYQADEVCGDFNAIGGWGHLEIWPVGTNKHHSETWKTTISTFSPWHTCRIAARWWHEPLAVHSLPWNMPLSSIESTSTLIALLKTQLSHPTDTGCPRNGSIARILAEYGLQVNQTKKEWAKMNLAEPLQQRAGGLHVR